MFLLMPAMLRYQIVFWIGLIALRAAAVVLYLATAWVLSKLGITLDDFSLASIINGCVETG
jgi:hypothetical protein